MIPQCWCIAIGDSLLRLSSEGGECGIKSFLRAGNIPLYKSSYNNRNNLAHKLQPALLMDYKNLPETELLDILAAQTAVYTDYLTIGAPTPKQAEAKIIIDAIVNELCSRKNVPNKND